MLDFHYHAFVPKALVHGPRDKLGLGLDDIYIDQGAAKVEILLDHLHAKSMTGYLIRSAIEWSTIHVRLG